LAYDAPLAVQDQELLAVDELTDDVQVAGVGRGVNERVHKHCREIRRGLVG
jgi:hypothetical protein